MIASLLVSFTFVPEWLRGLEVRASMGPIQLLSDVQPRCEALLLQSEVQFVLSHAHPCHRGFAQEPGHGGRMT